MRALIATRGAIPQFIGGMVYLKRKDGKEIQVPLDKLSDADRDFLKHRR